MKKNNCILFTINDGYCFALAVMLYSLRDNAPCTLKSCDIIVYHDGITPKNKNYLNSIIPGIIFKDDSDYDYIDKTLYNLPQLEHWGKFLLFKLFGFYLINSYSKVLYLDVDMMVLNEFNELFELNHDMAFLPTTSLNTATIKHIFHITDNKKDVHIAFGPLILFSNTILIHSPIYKRDISEAIEFVKDNPSHCIEERTISYLAYKLNLDVLKLGKEYASLPFSVNKNTKIVHFMMLKPWDERMLSAAFPEWLYYFTKWSLLASSVNEISSLIKTEPILKTRTDLLIYNFAYKNLIQYLSFSSNFIISTQSISELKLTLTSFMLPAPLSIYIRYIFSQSLYICDIKFLCSTDEYFAYGNMIGIIFSKLSEYNPAIYFDELLKCIRFNTHSFQNLISSLKILDMVIDMLLSNSI